MFFGVYEYRGTSVHGFFSMRLIYCLLSPFFSFGFIGYSGLESNYTPTLFSSTVELQTCIFGEFGFSFFLHTGL